MRTAGRESRPRLRPPVPARLARVIARAQDAPALQQALRLVEQAYLYEQLDLAEREALALQVRARRHRLETRPSALTSALRTIRGAP